MSTQQESKFESSTKVSVPVAAPAAQLQCDHLLHRWHSSRDGGTRSPSLVLGPLVTQLMLRVPAGKQP